MTFWICATCAVESAEQPDVCAICADERQWVPASGQRWTTLDELRAQGYRAHLEELEPDLYAITSSPSAGIGQQSKLVVTPEGSLLWDPIGFLDDDGGRADPARSARSARSPRATRTCTASRSSGAAPWATRPCSSPRPTPAGSTAPTPSSRRGRGEREVLPGVTLSQPGGHFPGSAVAHWAAGADGKGVLLSGDTIFANPDRQSVAFMRSYPNHLPLSGAVARRVADHVDRLEFDRLYGNFANVIAADAKEVVRRSADRHIGWANGDFDHLT